MKKYSQKWGVPEPAAARDPWKQKGQKGQCEKKREDEGKRGKKREKRAECGRARAERWVPGKTGWGGIKNAAGIRAFHRVRSRGRIRARKRVVFPNFSPPWMRQGRGAGGGEKRGRRVWGGGGFPSSGFEGSAPSSPASRRSDSKGSGRAVVFFFSGRSFKKPQNKANQRKNPVRYLQKGSVQKRKRKKSGGRFPGGCFFPQYINNAAYGDGSRRLFRLRRSGGKSRF